MNQAYNIDHIKLQLSKEFEITTELLRTIIKQLNVELEKGLDHEGATVPMIPSFITKRPSGKEIGEYLTIALESNILKICDIQLKEGDFRIQHQQKYMISEELKTSDIHLLFDYMADCLEQFMMEYDLHHHNNNSSNNNNSIHLGFSFSFPILQTDIHRGTLMYWTKGYQCTSFMNQDVVLLLQQACQCRNINVKITALVNDTISTLMGFTYLHPQTDLCIILGTGINACYFEKLEKIKKWDQKKENEKDKKSFTEMAINTEWGAFDNEKRVLPLTIYDNKLDRESTNPKQQIYEKLISSYYLGEIVRNVMMQSIDRLYLFKGHSSRLLNQPMGFTSKHLMMALNDTTDDLSIIQKRILHHHFHLPISSITWMDCHMVKYICELVVKRAAQLAAAGIGALLSHTNALFYTNHLSHPSSFTSSSSSSSNVIHIAMDGFLFESVPNFEKIMLSTLKEIFGTSIQERIKFVLAKDCSSLGASVAAMLSS
ncbi:unnamed protein product [Cunninghamella blakesleeana]